jgi:hypothetical protein
MWCPAAGLGTSGVAEGRYLQQALFFWYGNGFLAGRPRPRWLPHGVAEVAGEGRRLLADTGAGIRLCYGF